MPLLPNKANEITMTVTRRPRTIAVVFSLVSLGACSDATAPALVLGASYSLTSYGGKPLPYVTYHAQVVGGASSCDGQITGGQIVFSNGGIATEIMNEALVCSDGFTQTSVDTASGSYTQTGSRISLTLQGSVPPHDSAGPYDISATLSRNELHIDQTIERSIGPSTTTLSTPQVFTLAH
jgi:hypothetical protein